MQKRQQLLLLPPPQWQQPVQVEGTTCRRGLTFLLDKLPTPTKPHIQARRQSLFSSHPQWRQSLKVNTCKISCSLWLQFSSLIISVTITHSETAGIVVAHDADTTNFTTSSLKKTNADTRMATTNLPLMFLVILYIWKTNHLSVPKWFDIIKSH